jgi:hypothetical protein
MKILRVLACNSMHPSAFPSKQHQKISSKMASGHDKNSDIAAKKGVG